MKRAAFAAALLCLACAAAQAADEAIGTILERAQLWTSRGREDLAREEIDKALRLDPRHPQALAALGRLQLRANQEREAAATLEKLRQASPNDPNVAQISALLRIRGPDRDRLRQARQLARAGRNDEAVAAFRALFPDGMPDDELALEYAQVLGGTKGGWERARVELADLARRHPDDSRYQVALHAHVSTRKPVDAATLRALHELSKDPAVLVSRQALEAWRRAVLAMDAVEASIPPLREYVAANPGETSVAERLQEVERTVERDRRIAADPGLRAKREGIAAFEAGRLDEAGAKLEAAVAIYPRDAEALGTLGLVRLREERHAQAAALFGRAAHEDAAGRAKWEGLERVARYWMLVGEARDARQAGRFDEAQARAREAVALDPDEGQAAAELQRVVSARRQAEARAHAAAGRWPEAIAAYEAAAAIEKRDPWLRLDLARAYAAHGESAKGEAVFRDLISREPADADARFAYAIYLSGLERLGDALVVLEEIPAHDRSAAMTRMQRRLWVDVQSSRARALAELGQTEEAAAVVAQIRSAAQGDAEMSDIARRLEDDDAMRRARTLRDAGRNEEAAAIYRAQAAKPGGNREATLALTDTLLDMRDTSAARPLVASSLEATPNDARVLSQAGRLAIAEGRAGDAIGYEQRAMALAPRDDEAWRYRRLADLLDRSVPWFGGALDVLHRSGTPGKSQLDAQELPIAGRRGWSSAGEWLLRVAPSHITAGELDRANGYETARFGSMLLCLPACADAPISSSEEGVAVVAGFEKGDWRFDLGTTPIGFPVVNVVGGATTHGEWGPVGYTIEAARRPLPSSQLSYAGMRDPNTGRTWGGVVRTGLRANLSRDSGGEYGAWSVLGLYSLTGRNVRDNAQAELMAGGYRRFINEPDRQLGVGLTGMLWRFRDDVGEFTFGHGGYYSPRSYRSLALPVTFAARNELFSYSLRASVSVAWSSTDGAPFYPTDAGLQSQAEALAPVTGVDPHYASSNNGRSYGRSFAAAAERQVGPGLFLGARVDIERSTNYTPSRLLLYLRFTPGASAKPVSFPPEPGVPGYPY